MVKNQKPVCNEPIDLTVGKLPTETVQTTSKRPKFADHFIYPGSAGPSRVIFNGPSGSGKTNFALSLLCDNTHMAGFFNFITVFCPSAGMQADYDHLTDKYPESDLRILDFTPKVLEECLEESRQLAEHCKEDNVRPPQTLYLFDDLINTPGFDKSVATLCTKARQWSISVWVISQSLMSLSRLMRLQASNLFCFSPTESEIERIAAECNNVLANADTVKEMAKHATMNRYEPFHINRHAPAHLQYRMGLTNVFVLDDPALSK